MIKLEDKILINGNDSITIKLLEYLNELYYKNIVVISNEKKVLTKAESLGYQIYNNEFYKVACNKIDIKSFKVVALLNGDDLVNLDGAFLLTELAPEIPILLRLFHNELKDKFISLLPKAKIISASSLAAPEFIKLALPDDLEIKSENKIKKSFKKTKNFFINLPKLNKDIINWILGLFILAVVAGVILFKETGHLAWFNAFYMVINTSFGEPGVELSSSLGLKIYTLILVIFGVGVVTLLYTLVTDWIVQKRISKTLGKLPIPDNNHVIVAGLGKIGTRIIMLLNQQGIKVVGVDINSNAYGVKLANQLEIPVRIGDMSDPALLKEINISSALAYLAVSDNDMANLEGALGAEKIKPGIRSVIRIFDDYRAKRIDNKTEIGAVRSVASITAPVFAKEIININN